MSTGEIFPHIPDLDLITWHAEHNRSVLAAVSPWIKITFLFPLVILVTVLRSFPALLVLFASIFFCCAVARLPLTKIVAWYAVPALFVLSLVGLMAWGEPGIPLLTFGIGGFTATLTDQGILLIFTLLVKALIIVTYSFLVLMTTRYAYIAGVIDRLFPDPLNQIFLLSYRFLFLTIALSGSLVKAVRSRGGGMIRSISLQSGIFAGIFALVFIRSFDRAERVHAAMTSRGYRGIYATATPVPPPSTAGILIIGAAVLGTIGIAAAAVAIPGGGLP